MTPEWLIWLLWILSAVLIVGGLVAIYRDAIVLGIVLIGAGLYVGPGVVSVVG